MLKLSDMAQQLGVPASTTYRYALSMQELGFLEREPSGGYRLGPQVIELAGRLHGTYLAKSYTLRLHSLTPPIANAEHFQTVYGDIQNYLVTKMVTDVDAVVHLAGEARSRSGWDAVRGPNIDGTYNVCEAARQASVSKIVFASTNHVTGFYDRNGEWPVQPHQPVRPDGFYAVTKVFGETLARYYSDEFGISIICLRIGWVLQRPHNY